MRTFLSALLLLALSARCASVAHGSSQRVAVTSSPSGAAIRVDCGRAPTDGGFTPREVVLPRGAEHCAIVVSKPGYADSTVTFSRMRSGLAWANLVPGLILAGPAGLLAAGPGFSGSNTSFYSGAIGGATVGTGLGVLIDQRTGAAFRQVPGSVAVTLRPRAGSGAAR